MVAVPQDMTASPGDLPANALPVPPILVVAPGTEQMQGDAAEPGLSEPGLHRCLTDGHKRFAIHGSSLMRRSLSVCRTRTRLCCSTARGLLCNAGALQRRSDGSQKPVNEEVASV